MDSAGWSATARSWSRHRRPKPTSSFPRIPPTCSPAPNRRAPSASPNLHAMSFDLRFLILVEGHFGPLSSKTANSCIRYTPDRVAAIMDSRFAGKTAHDVWSGLHTFLSHDAEFAARAAQRGVALHDLRLPPADLPVAGGRVRDVDATVVLTVGSDCNIGKMTAALQLRDGLAQRGRAVRFAGTGQTGILIEGWGIAVDAVIADFIAGAAERLVLEAAEGADIVLVEGQGSVIHPGYSGVTLGLLHGSLPHAL